MSSVVISHRGNLNGPNPARENHPDYIEDAIKSGFHVEVDVWYIDDKWFLGHDEPQYETSVFFLNRSAVWCHAKNYDALNKMLFEGIHCFWHENDAYTVTSFGFIWAYPGQPGNSYTITVMPEEGVDVSEYSGVCTDYPTRY